MGRRASDLLLHGILDNVADGVITSDEKRFIKSFSFSAEMMFGYGSEEVIGLKVNLLP